MKRLAFSISEVAIWESRLTFCGIVSCIVMLLMHLYPLERLFGRMKSASKLALAANTLCWSWVSESFSFDCRAWDASFLSVRIQFNTVMPYVWIIPLNFRMFVRLDFYHQYVQIHSIQNGMFDCWPYVFHNNRVVTVTESVSSKWLQSSQGQL